MSAAEQLQSTVSVRQMVASDAPFVLDSWLTSFRDNNPEAKLVPSPVYRSMQRFCIDRILSKPDTRVLVACNPGAQWQILGWAAVGESAGQGVLHYLYIKQDYRGFDLTSFLAEPLRGRCRWYSHRTPKLERVARSLGLTFNPYLAGALL